MRSFRRCFWLGLAFRWAFAALDRRPTTDEAQAIGRVGSALSACHVTPTPWLTSTVTHALVGSWSWLGLWALVSWFRKTNGPKGDGAAFGLAGFFAFYFAFPLLYDHAVPEVLATSAVCLLWLAQAYPRPWRSGWWAGWAAVLSYPAIVWSAGALALGIARAAVAPKPVALGARRHAVAGTALGFAMAVVLGGLLARGRASGPIFAGALDELKRYWSSLPPWASGMGVFGGSWQWLATAFTPLAAPLVGAIGVYALLVSPALLVFNVPAVIALNLAGRTLGENQLLAPLTPLMILAVAQAYQRGWFGLQRLPFGAYPRVARATVLVVSAANFAWLAHVLGWKAHA